MEPNRPWLRLKIGLIVLVGAAMALLVILHKQGLNGPSYFPWAWRRLEALPLYTAILIASLPVLLAQILHARARVLRWLAVALLVLGCFSMKLASALVRPQPLTYLSAIVEDPDATSYFTDAVHLHESGRSVREVLRDYPKYMPGLNLHSQTKPPGPLLYWLGFISLLGANPTASLVGGIVLGAIGALSIPTCYWLLKLLLSSDDAAFCGASFLAVCPGFVLFFPMFDPAYILLSAALIGFWVKALREDRAVWSVVLGAMLAVTLIITFNILVIGLFMVALVFVAGTAASLKQNVLIAAKHAAIALGAWVVCMFLIRLTIGYDPIATFRSAYAIQQQLLITHVNDRPYPRTIPWDLLDFALGTGWISLLLVIYCLCDRAIPRQTRGLVLIALGQLVIVAITGLLPGETARVWNFMLPLLMIPVGLELSRWPVWGRAAIVAVMALITAAIYQNMRFIY